MNDHRRAAVTGALEFAADHGEAAWLHLVRADIAAATLGTIDTSAAEQLPGVLGVFLAADLDLPAYGQLAEIKPKYRQPPLAVDEIRYVGERVAAIVATTQAQALDAEELLQIDYTPAKVSLDPNRSPLTFTATEQLSFDDASGEPTISLTTRNQRLAVAPLETVSAVVEPDDDGRSILRVGTQLPDATHRDLCTDLGLEHDQLHVIGMPMGGAFGGKTTGGSPDLTILVACSRQLDVAIRYVEPRSVNLATMHGRDQLQHLAIRADDEGVVSSIELDVLCDAGAYAGTGVIEPAKTALLASGPYMVRSVHTHTRSVQTNTAPTGSYRGPGRAEAAAVLERGMDLLARELRIDPAELRRRNLLRPFDFPYKTPTGALYDQADHRATLDAALSLVGADSVLTAQARLRDANAARCLGLGVATWVDATAGWQTEQHSCASIDRDGTIRLIAGNADAGQGHPDTMASLAADVLEIDDLAVVVERPDSTQPITSIGSFGSRTAQVTGSAVLAALRELRRKIQVDAAMLLDSTPAEVVQRQRTFHVRGLPSRRVTWLDVAENAHDNADPHLAPGLWSIGSFNQDDRTYPSGCHTAVVQVDVETGGVELLRLATATDCGTVLHDQSARDQARGAMVQGAAQALSEEVVYDRDGNPVTSSFADYGIPTAVDVPALDVQFVPTPTDRNPLGVKGLAETGMLGAPPAVQNAVVDALSHLGVRHVDMPCTPLRIWEAIRDAQSPADDD